MYAYPFVSILREEEKDDDVVNIMLMRTNWDKQY